MTWAKLCDSAASDPKWLAIEREHLKQYANCWTLWTQTILYCCRHHTDGLISKQALARVSPLTKRAVGLALPILEEAKLLKAEDGDVRVLNFLKYNFSRERHEQDKKRGAERQRELRERRAQGKVESNLMPNLNQVCTEFNPKLDSSFSNKRAKNQASEANVTPLLTGVVTAPPIPIPNKEEDQSSSSIHLSSAPVRLVERRTVLTETHTKQVETTEREMMIDDSFRLQQLQEFLAGANLAASLNGYQRRSFNSLPPSNRTSQHFLEGLRRLRGQEGVKNPVSYLLSTVRSLPPVLEQKLAPPAKMLDMEGLRAKWRAAAPDDPAWSDGVTRDVARSLERLQPQPTARELAGATAGLSSWDDVLAHLRDARAAQGTNASAR